MLNVDSLSCFYAKIQAIWNISFMVQEESITVILGSNGAGKSTILRTIAGLHEPQAGEILFMGESIEKHAPFERVERGISLVPEERRLFPFLTVEENLHLGAYIKRARSDTKNTMEQIYDLFPILSSRKDQLAGTLSGGEQQMAAIGRGLMSIPKLLMLDEPSLGLAPLITKQVFALIKDIHQTGVTVLLIEQNVHQSMRIADEVFVLESGRMIAKGTPDELSKEEHIKNAYLGI